MKKNGWILLLFVFLGMLAGALVADWLKRVPGLDFLTRTVKARWSPSADLIVLTYDINIAINVSLLSLAGIALAIWIYRKL
ncbi:DUF4321 domain-containing protein [Cohnella sp. JJ-181]|uniref:DUF4321 domain-containing protein n=1 Tax=Cohnella rhizoplanae TaxID=2974897 RepID=UPI0022FFC25A|nr:DUF4321 domain-containing protein [Cohnella sp. JJ-181]CAI6082343.1 hypothetical protein COHCIP112018_03612 [Cohnella sp. JJ-181]